MPIDRRQPRFPSHQVPARRTQPWAGTRYRDAALALALVVAACGPGTAGDLDSAGGSDGSAGDSSGELGTTEAVDESGSGTDADGTDGTGESPESWCLRGTSQPQLHFSDTNHAVADCDGNGLDEVWMTEALWDPVAEIQSSRIRAFELGADGQLAPVVDVEREGSVRAIVDIDGDGRLDVLMTQWDTPEQWWLAGLPELSIDEVAQPLVSPGLSSIWIDANGDGVVDVFEGTDTGLALHLGDGTGTFTLAGTHDYGREFGSKKVWPSDTPGVLLSSFEEQRLGFGGFAQEFHALSVSPVGEIAVLASGVVDAISVKYVQDFDGDGVPDALGHDEVSNQSMTYLHQEAPGQYAAQLTTQPVFGMAADTLTSADEVEILHWSNVEGEMWLRRPEDGGWPTAVPVTIEGPWLRAGAITTLQADGDGGRELLKLSYEGDRSRYSLWRLEPCQ